jgi:CDP-diacylglycerol--glycerol-3-phosphate 3-phosphatidyltransferase
MASLEKVRRATARHITQPVIKLLARTCLTPNSLTWIGFLLAAAAAALITTGYLFIAGLVVLFAGFFDMLDGALARQTNRVTRFGGVLDSTLDRLSEAVLMLGIMTFYILGQEPVGALLAGLALVGSFLVSYTRARIEILGLEGKVGFFTRTERVIILVLGLWFSQYSYILIATLAIIAIFSFLTAGQRLLYAWRQTRS